MVVINRRWFAAAAKKKVKDKNAAKGKK